MPGTIIITGGNDSLAVPATQLLAKYPEHTIILTQRNPQTINQPTSNSRVYVKKLDLEDFSAVHAFANAVATDVQVGKIPPLTSIICNAYHWNLRTAPELTGDGYEKTFQVNHIAHAALVLRLLGHFDSVSGCCIVLFISDAHWTGKNSLEKYPPVIRKANGLDALVSCQLGLSQSQSTWAAGSSGPFPWQDHCGGSQPGEPGRLARITGERAIPSDRFINACDHSQIEILQGP
ncbi:hypothetical protein AN0521.2 [Aspergillus nidulans FGSC A4]|uniref:3beta-hydroxysteroid 3-dehydrogenase n=1 Tax=Emericella nidulans (strain FGSC A4 / ATCC 38163 / CBS 112.46 / NRRL 194 / M139) TaxID=227321 RepID=Q5BG09_EMENI|nr:hypothetical protein [Aspergillus nidulans FGSC A4]EAA66620.1 hypothetical protein AN0521.2 [Aspergillus nidulans FGSC A4]CBF89316.1 TPA: conserved hypothetical protein [Aspergillus nidulans FGSC A4]|eukprot:XP_658125.1 hypothetical protein AN0521.2 [Aspergillus nidulans FGSC A4]